MKSIKDLLEGTIQNTTLKKSVCDGCGQEVELRKTIVKLTPERIRESTGWIGCKCEDKKLADEALETRERLKREKMLEVFDNYSLIPPKLREATMNMYEPQNESQRAAKARAAEYVNEFDPKQPENLMFYGLYGVGKSHLSRCIARGVMQKGYSAIFISVPKLLRKLRSTYNKDSEITEDQLITALEETDLLILDDLGAENEASQHAKEKLYDILDSRMGKATVFTTNLSPIEMLERNERDISRILEDAEVFKIEGENYRLRKFVQS